MSDHGQIKRLVLPQGWTEQQVESRDFQLWTLRQFHPSDNPAVTLSVYYRGHPISAASGANFENLLEREPHELDESECWSVQEVLRDAALPEVFVPSKIETGDWNGKRVLLVEGVWARTEERSFGVYINAADHGCQVQEIFYRSPAADYVKHKHAVMGALYSIEWVPQRQEPET